ncbi:MAG: hypothetical protein WBN68_07575 [Sedimenticolaceae bacterium]
MSLDNEGLPLSWEEIKAASRRLDVDDREREEQIKKRVARQYLADTECDDARVREHIAIPGYN